MLLRRTEHWLGVVAAGIVLGLLFGMLAVAVFGVTLGAEPASYTFTSINYSLPDRPSIIGVVANQDHRVVSVLKGGPADLAGIQAGDVLLAIGDTSFEDNQAMLNEFADHVKITIAPFEGKPLPIVVRRNGQHVQLTIVPQSPSRVVPRLSKGLTSL